MTAAQIAAMKRRADDTLATGFRSRPRNSVEVRARDLAQDVAHLTVEVEALQRRVDYLVRQITQH